MGETKHQLAALYDQVPATRCASSGECCRLTPAEYDRHYATMFPLYRVEYAHIVDHVQRQMPAERRRYLLSFTEERPRRCPFLGADDSCTIYSVRPLICRTYGVMNPRSIQREARRHQGALPPAWIGAFAARESSMVCPRVAVLEPEKVERHARHLIDGTYERELARLSAAVQLADGERLALFARASGRRTLPLTWSWGGFNSVRFAPLQWLRTQFAGYWREAALADAI